MITIGIDQSYTSSGVVVLDDDGKVVDVRRLVSDKKLDMFDRAWQMANFVVDTIIEVGADFIAIEGLAFGIRGSATRDLAGLQYMIVCLIRHRTGRDAKIIAPLTLKKFATGSGKASKKDMVAAIPPEVVLYMKEEKGLKTTTGLTDVADAYFLAKFMYREQQSVSHSDEPRSAG
jgi:Holliday junction resolvasome RuvABC endonuclease subunit